MSGHHIVAPIIGGVNAGSAAAKAGIQTGDRILEIGDQRLLAGPIYPALIGPSAGQALTMVVQRQNQRVTLKVTPDGKTVEDPLGGLKRRGMLGITSASQAPFVAPQAGDSQLKPFDRISKVDGKAMRTLHDVKLAWLIVTPPN